MAGVVEMESKKEYYVDDMLTIRRDRMAAAPITDKNGYGMTFGKNKQKP